MQKQSTAEQSRLQRYRVIVSVTVSRDLQAEDEMVEAARDTAELRINQQQLKRQSVHSEGKVKFSFETNSTSKEAAKRAAHANVETPGRSITGSSPVRIESVRLAED